MSTIIQIIDEGLCTGCGMCKGMCPQSAISIQVDKEGINIPIIKNEKCIDCGICYASCSGKHFSQKEFNFEIFGKQPDNIFLGNYIECYTSHSTDQRIRHHSASGGVITSLLIYALENGIISGAIVTRMNKNNPFEPEPFIARNKEDILDASRSKYCPVAANSVIDQVIDSKEWEKFAFVGLPCHINSLRKAEKINPKLKEKIKYHFGIICSHTDKIQATNYLLKKENIDKNRVVRIDYRGEGWPGKLKIQLNDNNIKYIELNSPIMNIFHNSGLFTPLRCLLCNDLMAEFSDISCGDAWISEIIERDHEGESLIISRSNNGEELLKSAKSNEQISLQILDEESAIESQATYIYIKKFAIKNILIFRKFLNKSSPELCLPNSKNDIISVLVAFNLLTANLLGVLLSDALTLIPVRIFSIYISLFYGTCMSELKKKLNRGRFIW